MSSSYTDSLRLEKQGDGENINTWGTKVNTGFDLVDDAITGFLPIAVAGGTYTLSANNAASDEARLPMLKFTGTLASNQIIQIPAKSKKYMIWDATTRAGFTFSVKTSGGAAHVIASTGTKMELFCDGTDVHQTMGDKLTVPLDANDQVISQAEFKDYSETAYNLGSLTGVLSAGAIDYRNGPIQYGTLSGNITIANDSIANWPASGKGGNLILKLTQDATGGRTLTLGTAFKKANGSLSLSTSANARDRVFLQTEDAGTTIDASAATNFS